MVSPKLILPFLIPQALALQSLRACASEISHSTPPFALVREQEIGKWVQCDYLKIVPNGAEGKYCFYYIKDFTLAHYPDTPLRVDSSPDCPQILPLASKYQIKSAAGKCVTANAFKDGAHVTIEDCINVHGKPNHRQVWEFHGSQIRINDFCLDVTDGSTANGVKMQVWKCFDGNTNQEFNHSGGEVLTLPPDIITWHAHPKKCLDLTDGNEKPGTRIQMWDCTQNNPNQVWTVSVVT